MDSNAQQERTDRYLASRQLRPRSEETYREALRWFRDWATKSSIGIDEIDTVKLARYESFLRAVRPPLSENTVTNRLGVVQRYYAWLAKEGIIPYDRVHDRSVAKRPVIYRELLSIEDLRAMWAVTADDKDRVVLGLLAFNSLRLEDIYAARLEDLVELEGFTTLRLRSRERKHARPYAVIAPELLAAIRGSAAGRRTGSIVLTRQGVTAPRRTINGIVGRLAQQAKIAIPVTSLTVTFSMRAIAMERGFSYVGVLRATGVLGTRQLADLVARAPYNLALDPGIRMSQLVASPSDETAARLSYSERLLHEGDAPPAVAAMLAGATLEAHLRELIATKSIAVKNARLNIMVLATALRGAGTINAQEVQRLAAMAEQRDRAAHGWFVEADRRLAEDLIQGVYGFIRRNPVDPT